MDMLRLTCGACRANLDVPDGVQCVNCRYCGASLQVQRTESVVYTETQDAIVDTRDRLKLNTEILVLQGRLAQLDREWDHASKQFMVRGKRRGYHVPSIFLTVIFCFMLASFAWIWSLVAIFITGFVPLVGVGLLFTGVAIYLVISTVVTVSQFNSALSEYEQRRSELLIEIEELEAV